MPLRPVRRGGVAEEGVREALARAASHVEDLERELWTRETELKAKEAEACALHRTVSCLEELVRELRGRHAEPVVPPIPGAEGNGFGKSIASV